MVPLSMLVAIRMLPVNLTEVLMKMNCKTIIIKRSLMWFWLRGISPQLKLFCINEEVGS